MLSREETLQNFSVLAWRIASPGKFNGEMLYVPHFWDAFLEGGADFDIGRSVGFNLTPEDRKLWPELGKRRRRLWLYRDDEGNIQEVRRRK